MHPAASEAPVVLVGNDSTHLENASIITRLWALVIDWKRTEVVYV